MSTQSAFELLKQELAEAQRRAEEAEQQRQREQRRAEEAELQRQREQRRAEEAEQQTRKTTFVEYIEACHQLLFTRFAIETDKSLTSKGSITNPENKRCPTRLLVWSGFLEEQRMIFGRLDSKYHSQSRVFESLSFLHGLGERVARRRIANEKDLEYVEHNIVEDPVTSIIERLVLEDEVREEFDLGNGVVFDNHPNAISDVAEEVLERRSAREPPRTPGRTGPDLYQLRPDQICVYKKDQGNLAGRRLAYIVEYKPPHKLTLPHLRLGLRPLDIYMDVVNRAMRPPAGDSEALFRYHADRLVAAAVTQTFHYMIEGGLEYGYLTTGEAIVFLKIDWTDPTTLYYHLAEPGAEVEAHQDNFRYCTAVSQVFAFSLQALESPTHGQGERHRATERLNTWREDYETILRSIPVSERKQTPPSSAYEPRTYKDMDRSPYLLRRRNRPIGICRPEAGVTARNQSPGHSDEESEEGRMPDTPVRPVTRSQRGLARRPREDGRQGSSLRGGAHQYCTQRCLLGLAYRTSLDERCPNVSLHRRQDGRLRNHPVDHATWLRLLCEQLAQTLDDGVVPLGKQGARGVLFQVSLLAYGYTFIGKGTVPEFVEDLQHEAKVYDRLKPMQGVCVPVFLGAVGLERPYYYDFRVRIVHMIFLSWGGDSVDEAGRAEDTRRERGRGVVRSVRALHTAGVVHRDVRGPNALWSEENRRVMLIDFERALLVDRPRPPVAQSVANKRARLSTEVGLDKNTRPSQQCMMQEDILAAKIVFKL